MLPQRHIRLNFITFFVSDSFESEFQFYTYAVKASHHPRSVLDYHMYLRFAQQGEVWTHLENGRCSCLCCCGQCEKVILSGTLACCRNEGNQTFSALSAFFIAPMNRADDDDTKICPIFEQLSNSSLDASSFASSSSSILSSRSCCMVNYLSLIAV